MKDDLRGRLSALAPLAGSTLPSTTAPCKICQSAAPYWDTTDFQKCAAGHPFGMSGVEARWYRCGNCGCLFTPFFDDWNQSDFANFVYNDDYIRVDPDYAGHRPAHVAQMLAGKLEGCENLRILDYGSGNGSTAKHMAALGFPNVEGYDPFSQPNPPAGKFDIVLCFEVIEHAPDPLGVMAHMKGFLRETGGCIILGESLQPPDIAHLRASWWYCAPRNGHCTTFSDDTLAIMAGRFGLVFHRGGSVHSLRLGADPRSNEIARRFGGILVSEKLGAPEGAVDGWHAPEHDFRWTATPRLNWRVPALRYGGPATVRVRIPFMNEIRPGFADECRVEINGRPAVTKLVHRAINAEADGVEAGDQLEFTLVTPPLCSPAELRGGGDTRRLGLAIQHLVR